MAGRERAVRDRRARDIPPTRNSSSGGGGGKAVIHIPRVRARLLQLCAPLGHRDDLGATEIDSGGNVSAEQEVSTNLRERHNLSRILDSGPALSPSPASRKMGASEPEARSEERMTSRFLGVPAHSMPSSRWPRGTPSRPPRRRFASPGRPPPAAGPGVERMKARRRDKTEKKGQNAFQFLEEQERARASLAQARGRYMLGRSPPVLARLL